ncbi:MAG: hypothetical protein JST59_22315 [Actinobacteria bacterium]|nr:hypothetical protein [Actinomycetota bacterium]
MSTAIGGGHRTPAYFPAILLTALGGGVGGNLATGRRGGAAVASAYLGGCGLTLKPWRNTLDRKDWWNVAAALGFLGSGIVGAIAGDLSLKMRALTDFAEREGEAAGRATMEEKAEKVTDEGKHFLELLGEVDRAFEHSPEVGEATADLATALSSLRTIRTIPTSEEQKSLATWPRLHEIADDYNATAGNVQVELRATTEPPPSASAPITDALCECATALIQNAANARPAGAFPVKAAVTLDLRKEGRRKVLRMTVEDNAGGSPVPSSKWSRGLLTSSAAAEQLGGAFSLEAGEAGLRAVFEVPYVSSRDAGVAPTTFVRQANEGRDACLRALRRVTATQAVFIALSTSERKALLKRLGGIAGLFAAGELVQRLPERSRASAAAPLGVLAMSAFPGPGRPPLGGWACVMCAQASSSGRPNAGWLGAISATAGATLVAGPERFSSAMETTIGDRTFALVGALVGHSVWRGILRLRGQEERLADEEWQRQALSDLAAPERQKHNLLKPVEDAMGGTQWRRFKSTDLGSKLVRQEGCLREAQRGLERLFRQGDPLRELQHQLARMLAPAPVRVFGEWPKRTVPQPKRELEAVRYRLGLIGLGQAIAVRIRDYLPTSFLLPEQLQELQIHVEVIDDEPNSELTRFTIVQVPFKASEHDRIDTIVADASRRAGGKTGRKVGNTFEVYVHNTALR